MKSCFSPFVFLSIFLLLGCDYDLDSKNNDNLPSEVYEELPSFSSFNLSEEYIYWEIRMGNMPHQDSTDDEIVVRYDEDIFLNLSPVQKIQLASMDSITGFDAWCAPSYCPVFGVALLPNEAIVIESRQDLLTFFGTIDTVAELGWWISSNNYGLRKYEITDYGYRVVASWDNDCGTRGEDLIKVYRDGTIEKIRELSSESYNGCV